MSTWLGTGGILLALAAAVALAVQGFRVFRGAAPPSSMRRPVYLLAGGALAAMLALELGLLTNDFSVSYVANHHRSTTPLVFAIATAWAALEGSIVLWGLVLAGYILLVHRAVSRRGFDRLGAGALAVMALVAVFFFGLMATAANPFRVLEVVPVDGRGPNALLQNNILMAVHPPLLYL
ncbi:MAG: heme lyase CcmF/NrfE family subunit, partial [Acidimicrobiia bacterium]